jgi:hypothetical protein
MNIKNIIAIITIIVALVKELIEVFEIPGYGAEKKQAILDVLAMVFDVIQEHLFELPFSKDKLLSIAGGLIDIFVSFFNSTGQFVHSLTHKG